MNTCSEADSEHIAILRRMGGEKRLKVGLSLYDLAVSLARQSILERHPGITKGELKKKILERFGHDPGRTAAAEFEKFEKAATPTDPLRKFVSEWKAEAESKKK